MSKSESPNAKSVGRPTEPRLGALGETLRTLAKRAYHNSLSEFYTAAEARCQKLQVAKSFESIKREFEKAFAGTGPFGLQLQDLFHHLVGLPPNVQTEIKYVAIVEAENNKQTNSPPPAVSPTGETPPELQILASNKSIQDAQLRIVREAQSEVAATGSRSRHEQYFQAIEKRLRREKPFRYYRVLCGPPRNKVLIAHLDRVAKIRDPDDHWEGKRTLCIGVAQIGPEEEPERLLVTNEREALIALPSVIRLGDYDTALLVRDTKLAADLRRFVHEYFMKSEQLKTKEAVLTYLKGLNSA